jgi:hypothetical protein
VVAGVDDLVQRVPEYRRAVDAGGEEKVEAYMKYRDEAKLLLPPIMDLAVAQRQSIVVEWTYEGNLQNFANGEEVSSIPARVVEDDGYDIGTRTQSSPQVGSLGHLWYTLLVIMQCLHS